MRTISKLGAVVAVAGLTVAVIRKYDLIAKGAALAEQGVEKVAVGAEWATAKATELADRALTLFADDQTDEEKEADAAATLTDYILRDRGLRTENPEPTERPNAPMFGDVR